ncbi:MAG: zinc-binding dehydrogenase [Acidimicrobiia bacterium]|nr:zinc-binding dehydrogenase [Acidimicrobiia bacterium]
MRTGLITGKGRFELLEVADPVVTPGAALVEIDLCGICGSDVHAYQSGGPYPPAVCGHEWTGVVSAVASDVTHVAEGDRVVGGAAPPCGRCGSCERGDASRCSRALRGLMGSDGFSPASGGFAATQAVHARRLARVPAQLSTEQAAMTEPTMVAAHAVRRSRIRLGDVVTVIGAGPIGLLALQCARAAGAGRAFVVEPDPARGALARELGADQVFAPGHEAQEALDDLTRGTGPDVVFDCAGVAATVNAAARLVRRGGNVCLVGVAIDKAEINAAMWVLKEITIDTSAAYGYEDLEITLGLIADGRVQVAPLHHATVSLDELGATFDELASGPSEKVKVLVDPRR